MSQFRNLLFFVLAFAIASVPAAAFGLSVSVSPTTVDLYSGSSVSVTVSGYNSGETLTFAFNETGTVNFGAASSYTYTAPASSTYTVSLPLNTSGLWENYSTGTQNTCTITVSGGTTPSATTPTLTMDSSVGHHYDVVESSITTANGFYGTGTGTGTGDRAGLLAGRVGTSPVNRAYFNLYIRDQYGNIANIDSSSTISYNYSSGTTNNGSPYLTPSLVASASYSFTDGLSNSLLPIAFANAGDYYVDFDWNSSSSWTTTTQSRFYFTVSPDDPKYIDYDTYSISGTAGTSCYDFDGDGTTNSAQIQLHDQFGNLCTNYSGSSNVSVSSSGLGRTNSYTGSSYSATTSASVTFTNGLSTASPDWAAYNVGTRYLNVQVSNGSWTADDNSSIGYLYLTISHADPNIVVFSKSTIYATAGSNNYSWVGTATNQAYMYLYDTYGNYASNFTGTATASYLTGGQPEARPRAAERRIVRR
ncbi:MAG: hypothetical protein U5N86_03955 [Planctomycetota bacterium]|nr:hypothetical protein [Planctomycetota bacterium]